MGERSEPLSENSSIRHRSVHPKYWNIPDARKRSLLTRMPFISTKPPPPPKESLDDADFLPEATANILDLLTFGWLTDLMSLGYKRPLEATDLYKLPPDRGAAYIADEINASFDRRQKKAEEYNKRLANGEVRPGLWRNIVWTVKGNPKELERKWREIDGRKKASLTWAINDSVKWWFWSGALFKIVGDIAQVTSPLLVKAIINFSSESYSAHKLGLPAPEIGKGIGLSFALLVLQVISSLCVHHWFYRVNTTGVLVRGGLITAIYRRSLKLTSRARGTLTNGKLINHISTDVSRIDLCAGFFHMGWSAAILLIICLILLTLNLGPSAIAGFTFFAVATPPQIMVLKRLFTIRGESMVWTDKRAKLLHELLGGMKVIKYFAWENPFLRRLVEFRQKEMAYIRSLLFIRAGNNAVATSMPVLAAAIAFVVYSAMGHSLDPAIIFSSLSLFNLLRLPLMMLPVALSTSADAANAISRLYNVFEAELLTESLIVDRGLKSAIEVDGAAFTWDVPPDNSLDSKDGESDQKKSKAKLEANRGADENAERVKHVFRLTDIAFSIPRGQLVAIVGVVGSGKTSLLQGIIGEMRRTSGTVRFGGSVAYSSQSAWIQNATIRENICFGRPFEEARYWNAVRDSCLEHDLNVLPHSDLTEVGEKGISLSGGQKQRVNICRAIYCNTDIQIFDDPLSALDAHVGEAVFQNVFQKPGKTRVLVTHALHFLPQVDYIYTIADGRIAERGTYQELMSNKGEFSRLLTEFGSKDNEEGAEKKAEAGGIVEKKDDSEKRKNVTAGAGLMQAEERNTGAVNWDVYKTYAITGRGNIVLPLLFCSLVLFQGATVMFSYWLVYWQERKWPQPPGFYMGIYAMLGMSQAVANFFMGCTFALLTYFASQRLHKLAIERVMHAPMSFFETTPLGRIMNRFSKDIDTIDNLLGESLRLLATMVSQIVGAIILISIVLPWFLIGVFFIIVLYTYVAVFYRASARELKRLDAILRSSLYSHFSESLSGLATIRAYGEMERFRVESERRVDVENRAYWLTQTNQRWLGVRLDFLGIILTFIVAMLAVGTRSTTSPAQTGLVLSFILNIQLSFGFLVRQLAEVENDMNSVERMVHYATKVEQEAPHELSVNKPPAGWPTHGRVELKNVFLSYRPGLPAALKGLNLIVQAGEKIGIVGRTGAGKSSIMTALYRIVELTSGSILVDGVDISKVGLTDLRNGLAIIPQDPLLFSGTLRTNLDPFGLHTDVTLWDALKRAFLVDNTYKHSCLPVSEDDVHSRVETPTVKRFTLDTVIEDEGGNLSIGQRCLISLARALVKDSKVIILDEATASVDYETDRNIQSTIAHGFKDRTILCIAHRLRTIMLYDRICVLDAGQIAELDSPINLYKRPNGIFRSMCERSLITLDDLMMDSKKTDT